MRLWNGTSIWDWDWGGEAVAARLVWRARQFRRPILWARELPRLSARTRPTKSGEATGDNNKKKELQDGVQDPLDQATKMEGRRLGRGLCRRHHGRNPDRRPAQVRQAEGGSQSNLSFLPQLGIIQFLSANLFQAIREFRQITPSEQIAMLEKQRSTLVEQQTALQKKLDVFKERAQERRQEKENAKKV